MNKINTQIQNRTQNKNNKWKNLICSVVKESHYKKWEEIKQDNRFTQKKAFRCYDMRWRQFKFCVRVLKKYIFLSQIFNFFQIVG